MSYKILMVVQEDIDKIGGSIYISLKLAEALANAGYDIAIIFSNNECIRPPNLNKKILSINLDHLYPRKKFSYGFNKYLENNKVDLIIFSFPYLILEANLRADFNHIPRILMFHSRPDFYLEQNLTLKKKLPFLYINTVSQILFPNFFHLLPDYIKKSEVICIPNFLPLISKKDNYEEHKKIVYLTRLDPSKGVDFLINSFFVIAKKYPDWKLDIYGPIDKPDYLKYLKNLIKDLELESQVNLSGTTNAPLNILPNYDFCVFSSFFEGFPIGLIEAQSVGLPAIGLKGCSGVNELIIDGENGYLSDEDYAEFSQKIEILINNRELRKKFSNASHENAKKYSESVIIQKWIEVISNILEHKKNDTITKPPKQKYVLFPMEKVLKIWGKYPKKTKYKIWEYIFSIKNERKNAKKHKVVCLLGIKLKFRTS